MVVVLTEENFITHWIRNVKMVNEGTIRAKIVKSPEKKTLLSLTKEKGDHERTMVIGQEDARKIGSQAEYSSCHTISECCTCRKPHNRRYLIVQK